MDSKESIVKVTDTTDGMKWSDFLKIVLNYGFEFVVRRRFKDCSLDEITYPEFIIAAHKTKFLLLVAESDILEGNETLSGGTVYGNLAYNGFSSEKVLRALSGCSWGWDQSGFHFDYDIRFNLISKLDELEKASRFIKWGNPDAFIWLPDYTQEDLDKTYQDWVKYRDDFLNEATDWTRDFIINT